ncbi:Fe(3+)-hydroxamate ABC transporter permease FhuB [Burkholderia sp. Ac-20379]|nr:Fe(3+)-hydroxamate ABC transporter permease FhuB [Burkholderia sp. Ac-20379]
MVAGFGLLALVLSAFAIHAQLGGASFWATLVAPDRTDLHQVLVRDSLLPRIAMTLLCGAALGLAGTLTQQVLRNPLAEPLTLGIFPGAYLALMVAALWMPSWLAFGRTAVAFAGGGLAMLVVFALAARQRMASLSVILSGMVVNLYCGAICLAIALSHFQLLRGLMIWGGGALDQTGWGEARGLAIGLALCVAATVLLRRAFAVFEAGDATVASLGVGLQRMRFAALLIALVLTACVVSSVGVIAFVGLAAPMLARLAGARRLGARLVWAPAIGASLLWATDALVRIVQSSEVFSAHVVPTGTVTSLVGVPFLLWMLPRLRSQPDLHAAAAAPIPHGRLMRRAPFALAALVLVIALAVGVSRGVDGWHIRSSAQIAALAFWRIPHLVAALSAGVLLAVSGTLIQRVTANPMASPDLLGVSSGGALGIMAVLLLGLAPAPPILLAGCIAGSLVTLGIVMGFGVRAQFAPERMLLVGVAISALFQAVVSALLSSGDSRGDLMLNFILGSTYYVPPSAAYAAAGIAVLALVLGPLLGRWVDSLGLGAATAASLGVPVSRARATVLVLAAILAAAATLIVGPLSFVGLVAPHIARYSGARKSRTQMMVAALIGALLMGLAEWLGRQVAFPMEMPAGLVATLIGGPYLVALMLHRQASAT